MQHTNWHKLGRGAVAASAFLLAQILSGHVIAAGYDLGSLHITQPWARATPKGASAGAGYMTVTNNGTTAQRLSCESDDASAKCQIHSMTMDGGVMKMRPVEGGLEIKPGETVTFKPGGYHIMFVDLKEPLQQGKTVAATFKSGDGSTAKIDFPIAAIGAPAPGVAGGGEMKMEGPGMMQMNK